jgi:ribosomal protein S18 acetylase RimI-like enzyme
MGTSEDASSIVEINNSHIDSDDPGGFLVIELDETQVKQQIESGEMRFFVAKDANGELLGYAQVGNSIDLSLLDHMTWISEKLKTRTESILSGTYVYVKQLAVSREYQRRGVASFIYQKMEDYVGCPVVVFAAIRPKYNEPSVLFHEERGYTRVSRLYRKNFGEFSEYESFFYITW